MTVKKHKSAARRLVTAMLAMIMTLGMITAAAGTVHAAAQTVTLTYGSQIWFGDHPLSGHTSLKWVTHIDGEAVDTDEIPGVSRSYAYCVQPMADPPPEGTYNISIWILTRSRASAGHMPTACSLWQTRLRKGHTTSRSSMMMTRAGSQR